MTRKTLWQLLLYSVGNSNRILRHSRLSSLKILGVNSAFLETFTFLLFSREFFLSILTEIRQTSGKVKQETGKVIQEIQEHLLWVTVWFLSVVFLGSSLNRLNPTALIDLQMQVTYACKKWFFQYYFHISLRFPLVTMSYFFLDIWENRNETANFSQKHDVELIKEQKRYLIYILYLLIYYPKWTGYNFYTGRRTSEKNFHTILQFHQKIH